MIFREFISALRIAARPQTAQHFCFEMNLLGNGRHAGRIGVHGGESRGRKSTRRHLFGDGDARRADAKDFDAQLFSVRSRRGCLVQFGFHDSEGLAWNEFAEKGFDVLGE